MTWVDWIIVLILALAVLGGMRQGFFRAVCGLGGLILGLVLGAWNYGRAAAFLLPLAKIEPMANALGFVLIAVLTMAISGLVGLLLARALHQMGLGFVDTLAGAAFGFLQGTLLVTLLILVAVAFFPKAHWLVESKLPKMFFGACHLSTHMSPDELASRVREGLHFLEQESPPWLHPDQQRP